VGSEQRNPALAPVIEEIGSGNFEDRSVACLDKSADGGELATRRKAAGA